MGSSLIHCSFCDYDSQMPKDEATIERSNRVYVVHSNSICSYHIRWAREGWLQTKQAIDEAYAKGANSHGHIPS